MPSKDAFTMTSFLILSSAINVAIFSGCIIESAAFATPPSSTCREVHLRHLSPPCSRARSSSKSMTQLRMSNLEVLAKEGPWTAYLDEENTGLVYYFNSETGESSWDPPTSTFPSINLSKSKKNEMQQIRKEFNLNPARDNGTTEAKNNGAGGGLIASLFSGGMTKEKVVEPEPEPIVEEVVKEPAPSLFGGLFGAPRTTPTYDEESFDDAEEVYDQELFEDAVAVDDDDEKEPAKPSFVSDLMSIVSFPAAPKAAQVSEEIETTTTVAPLKVQIASKILPHPEKISWGGEDALYVGTRSFGVFDGVSGAEKLKGVPLYSNTLAQQLKTDIKKNESLSIDEMKAKLLSAAQFADVAATGASTALLASIGEDDILRSICLGDCQLLVIRNGSVFSRTRETTHYFECPYQLSEDSPDRPKDSTILSTKLMSGDVIISGSDGVFDNLDDASLLEIVSSSNKPNIVAQKLASESRRVSLDPEAPTPFAKVAQKNRYANYSNGVGGKVDDISCVVVNVI